MFLAGVTCILCSISPDTGQPVGHQGEGGHEEDEHRRPVLRVPVCRTEVRVGNKKIKNLQNNMFQKQDTVRVICSLLF